jgi:hypothetical protein
VGGGGGGQGAAGPSGGSSTFSGNPYLVRTRVAATSTRPAAEQYIAVDPTDSTKLVAVISDFAQRGGYNSTKYSRSTDNGATWSEAYVPFETLVGAFLESGDADVPGGVFWEANSDPVVAIDADGTAYTSNLYFDSSIDSANGIYVSKGVIDGSGNFSFPLATTCPVVRNLDGTTILFEDKDWMTVDKSSTLHRGRVYVTWTHFVDNTTDAIWLSWSDAPGATCTPSDWSAPIQVSLPAQDGAVQGSQVAVGPGGEVYVAYEVFYVGSQRRHFLTKSSDGGVTFSTPIAITPLFNELAFNSSYRKNSFTSLAVGPSGDVAAVYSDQPSGRLGAEVRFIRSTDGGTTFSAPLTINDNSSGQQFFPALTLDSSGIIHATWFDTRQHPRNNALYDVYATFSTDGGAIFAPNARVTPASINAGTASFIGDYTGIAAAANFAHPVWNDGGFNGGRLQTAILQLP